MTTMREVRPMLQARDLRETIDFYTGALGFELGETMDGPDGNPCWCTLVRDAAVVMFYTSEDNPEPAMTGVLYFYPDDVEDLWEELKDRAEVAWELQMMDNGMLEFAVRDCNGYVLSFGQDLNAPVSDDEPQEEQPSVQ